MWRLFVPLRYLLIGHPEKRLFDWYIPAGVTLGLWISLHLAGGDPPLFGDQGLITHVQGLLGILTGFFIAALAAVATFSGPGMDEPMPAEDPVVLVHKVRQVDRETGRAKIIDDPETLSRRRFLCFLFGFLAYMALALYLIGLVGDGLRDFLVAAVIPADWLPFVKMGFLLTYAFLFLQLIVVTLLGIFYLTDRIHRRPSRLVRGEPTRSHSNHGTAAPAE